MMVLDARYDVSLKHKIAELKTKFDLYEKQNDNLFEELLDLERVAINAYEKLVQQGFSDLALKTITELLGFGNNTNGFAKFSEWYVQHEHMVDEFFTENSVDMRFIYRRNQPSQNSF